MPDISMCANEDCPLKETCYRYRAIPNPHRQTYSGFKPEWNIASQSMECDYYSPVRPSDRLKNKNP